MPVQGQVRRKEQGMYKIKQPIVFTVNGMLLALALLFQQFSVGDEYLVLFVVLLIAMFSPYFLTPRSIRMLILLDLAFFMVYYAMKMLNIVDILVFLALMISSAGITYLVVHLNQSFMEFNRNNISKEESKYTSIVKELESVEREGRIVEKELARISHLYEMTKQFGAVLRFEDLMDTLFDFLEENFQFERAHFLMFDKGEFQKGISRSVATAPDNKAGAAAEINYEAFTAYMKETEFKPFYAEREDAGGLFSGVGASADTFLAFPIFVKRTLSMIMAIEGANKRSYNGFAIIVPQVALELKKVDLYEQVEKLSIMDGLTGVYLRRYLVDRLQEEVDRAKRLDMRFSVSMIDIDNFKQCNDKYGHQVGDAVLKEVAERLRTSVREVDMIARYGGEEFCIVLPETNKELAIAVAERLRKSVESAEIKAFDEKVKITISAGVATYPDDASSADAIMEMADTALYKAKRKGRNRVCPA